MIRCVTAFAAGLFACLSLGAGTAFAQDYPTRPVKIVVPFPAGGGTDALTRFVAKGLEQRLGIMGENERPQGTGPVLVKS